MGNSVPDDTCCGHQVMLHQVGNLIDTGCLLNVSALYILVLLQQVPQKLQNFTNKELKGWGQGGEVIEFSIENLDSAWNPDAQQRSVRTPEFLFYEQADAKSSLTCRTTRPRLSQTFDRRRPSSSGGQRGHTGCSAYPAVACTRSQIWNPSMQPCSARLL